MIVTPGGEVNSLAYKDFNALESGSWVNKTFSFEYVMTKKSATHIQEKSYIQMHSLKSFFDNKSGKHT